jgi:hypothetical protein
MAGATCFNVFTMGCHTHSVSTVADAMLAQMNAAMLISQQNSKTRSPPYVPVEAAEIKENKSGEVGTAGKAGCVPVEP